MPRIFDFSRLRDGFHTSSHDAQATSISSPSFNILSSQNHPITVCIVYGVVSLLANFLQNYLREVYAYSHPIEMTLCQVILLLCFLLVLRYFKHSSFPISPLPMVKHVYPIVLCSVVKVCANHFAQPHLNISSFTVFRRLTTVFVLWFETFTTKTNLSVQKHICILSLVISAMVSETSELRWSPIGFLLTLVSDITTAGELVFTHRCLHQDPQQQISSLLWSTNLVSLPFLVLPWYFAEPYAIPSWDSRSLPDPVKRIQRPEWQSSQSGINTGQIAMDASIDLNFCVIFFVAVFAMLLVRVATVYCIHQTSSLTTSVIGNIKNLLSWVMQELLFPTNVVVEARVALAALFNALSFIGYIYLVQPKGSKSSRSSWFDAEF
eukprot:TRINITY_DN20132_c0_g1_i1.p1 TRINITY_DN20132_c0_g1~~TRINITY_DN20132_c0_g1_i1.p1  ORF type:complete len:379 (-),score=75.13 TRINITY_DN20132_c0_g1_i1:426-1562(-)